MKMPACLKFYLLTNQNFKTLTLFEQNARKTDTVSARYFIIVFLLKEDC